MRQHRWDADVCLACGAQREWALARESCSSGGRAHTNAAYQARYTAERRARDPEFAQRLRDYQRAYAARKRAERREQRI
ncbi:MULTISPECIES: hypothetical protein [Sandaracinus]|uniref:hypothetical protein n=1 Tax=Sandaracinus TaxID=1055688 RepID=UPI0019D4530D|nr:MULTISPECIES: hypothetical protein [Sandaracinus]UJR87276.1 Hypothetical protein I5071_680 [Sandaracinus amylolyticus]